MVAPTVIEPDGLASIVKTPGKSAQPVTKPATAKRIRMGNFMRERYQITSSGSSLEHARIKKGQN